ncbi:hypothetical protein N0824_02832 [Microcystis sp. 0824]|nr:hypothetical protein N0824_02832 [Microcystis sp. 0824]
MIKGDRSLPLELRAIVFRGMRLKEVITLPILHQLTTLNT